MVEPFPLPGTTINEQQLLNDARYKHSIQNPKDFWAQEARKFLTWTKPFTQVLTGDFLEGTNKWFSDGSLNICYNAIDRHLATKADQVAMIWEGDEPGNTISFKFQDLHDEVCRIANVLKQQGVKKGDTVVVYMPMVPQLPMVMLACARIGAIHSVVFAGFSADALRERIVDSKSKFVVCANEGRRGGKAVKLKGAVDIAIAPLSEQVKNVFIFDRESDTEKVSIVANRDLLMSQLVPQMSPHCAVEEMNAEDPLLILYTSGSTGKPKGILHTTVSGLIGIGVLCEFL